MYICVCVCVCVKIKVLSTSVWIVITVLFPDLENLPVIRILIQDSFQLFNHRWLTKPTNERI